VKIDGETIGHMELKMGGSYDLNLKSSDLPKSKEIVKLADSGSNIVQKKSTND